MDKKQLARKLSSLKCFGSVEPSLEQYAMEPEIVAAVLWHAYLQGDIKNKIIADLGCGNGVFGVGALLLGAKKVYFLDIDKNALDLAKENSGGKGIFLCGDVSIFTHMVDVVFMNPPFGVQTKHADKSFLEVAFNHSKKIYSFHKLDSKSFIGALCKDFNWQVIGLMPFSLFLKKTMTFHTRKKYLVSVGCWILWKGKV